MKCKLSFLVFFLLSLGANAQMIDTYDGLFVSGVLCNPDGERLDDYEVEALSEYGFDLGRYNSLRKQTKIADTFFLIFTVPFIYTVLYDDIIGQHIVKNNSRYSKIDVVVGRPSLIVMSGACIWHMV